MAVDAAVAGEQFAAFDDVAGGRQALGAMAFEIEDLLVTLGATRRDVARLKHGPLPELLDRVEGRQRQPRLLPVVFFFPLLLFFGGFGCVGGEDKIGVQSASFVADAASHLVHRVRRIRRNEQIESRMSRENGLVFDFWPTLAGQVKVQGPAQSLLIILALRVGHLLIGHRVLVRIAKSCRFGRDEDLPKFRFDLGLNPAPIQRFVLQFFPELVAVDPRPVQIAFEQDVGGIDERVQKRPRRASLRCTDIRQRMGKPLHEAFVLLDQNRLDRLGRQGGLRLTDEILPAEVRVIDGDVTGDAPVGCVGFDKVVVDPDVRHEDLFDLRAAGHPLGWCILENGKVNRPTDDTGAEHLVTLFGVVPALHEVVERPLCAIAPGVQ